MSKGIVWVVNFTDKFDFSSALRYGELKPLTVGNVNIYDPYRLACDMLEKLEDFNVERDKLLLVGHSIVSLTAVNLILNDLDNEYVECLSYSSNSNSYVPIILKRNWDFTGEGLGY